MYCGVHVVCIVYCSCVVNLQLRYIVVFPGVNHVVMWFTLCGGASFSRAACVINHCLPYHAARIANKDTDLK